VKPYAEPDCEQGCMRKMIGVAPLRVNFDKRYLTRPELGFYPQH
jgi:hypothetical protein